MSECKKCGGPTFGRLCGACKGDPHAVARRILEEAARSDEFKEGALAALSGGRRHLDNPFHPKDEGRYEWFKGFDEAAKKLGLLQKQYE